MEMDGGISAEAGPVLLIAPSSAADKNSGQTRAAEGRLASLDFFRGLTMFLLIGEATGLYELLRSPAFHGALVGGIGWQLEHHPWNGLHCWDLVQPFFMFIVGVAMLVAISAGIPIGIACVRNPRSGRVVLRLIDMIQTIPSLALFGFLIPLPLIGGIGIRTAIVSGVTGWPAITRIRSPGLRPAPAAG